MDTRDQGYAHLFDLGSEPIEALLERMLIPRDAFAGRRVLFFGGSRGIGLHALRGLLHSGAAVAMVDIRPLPEALRGVPRLEFRQADLSLAQEVLEACAWAREVLGGPVEVLINNAAHMHRNTTLVDLEVEDWERTFALNTHSAFLAARQVLPDMLAQGRGVILFQMSLEGAPTWAGYCASKAALRSLSFSLAAEIPRESGVHIFSFAPGLVATELVREYGPQLTRFSGADFEEFVYSSGKNPGYKGMMPPEHTAAGMIHALLHAHEHHGLIADGLLPLDKAGVIALPTEEDTSRGLAEEDAIDVHMTDYVSGVSDMNQRIEARVTWRTRELEAQHEEIRSQKMESLGVLAAGIAHDFNNLLVGIKANIELALMDAPPEAQEALGDALQASHGAARLVRLMLDYSGHGHFELGELDLNKIVEESTRLAQTSIAGDIQVELKLQPSLPPIIGDVGQLQQVVVNLFLNAIEATSEGGCVCAYTRLERVAFGDTSFGRPGQQALTPGWYAILQIEDSGSGIPPELMERIFDPFFSTRSTGRGLGLSAVLGIVKGHQGGIKLASTPGQGTCFTIALPIDPAHAATLDHPQDPPLVLLIDDDPIVLKTLQRILRRNGHQALTATSGLEGIKLFQDHRSQIAMVFLDMVMSGMDGEETLRRLHALDPSLCVHLMSGFSHKDAKSHFRDLGFRSFIKKPFGARQILDLVQEGLDERKAPPPAL